MHGVPPQIQHLKTVHKAERGRPGTSEHQSHYPRWNGLVSTSERWLAEARCYVTTSGNINQIGKNSWTHHGKTSPCMGGTITKGGSGWYQEILIEAGKGLTERQHRCTDHGSTRSTRVIEPGSYQTSTIQGAKVILCKEAPETIQDMTSGCKMLAGRAYIKNYNQVADIMYRNICTKFGLETLRSNWDTPPMK